MAAIKRITREKIIKCALNLVRERGMGALNVRALAARLGCSTRPVYLNFSGMGEVEDEVKRAIREVYADYLAAEVASGRYPPYKAYGMAYIRFASEEKQFFSYMFMRDRTGTDEPDEDGAAVIAACMAATGLDEEGAKRFHLESWIFVHGIAAMAATGYIGLDEETVSGLITDMFTGLKTTLLNGGGR